jgi:asparagine synthase (glutamine-hydrolysing)
MAAALVHRGTIGSIDAPPPPGRVRIASDSAFNSPGEIEAKWRAAGGIATTFAASLEGSFSVAVLDGDRRLVLARDRLGEKPLSWSLDATGVAFASEIKAIRAAGLAGRSGIRPEALDGYLAFTYVPAPWSIHPEIHKVPAGHIVEIDLAAEGVPSARAERYWSAPARGGLIAGPSETIGRLEEALSRRLPSGAPPAAFLSGGLDSSLVVALLRRLGLDGIRTISIGFEEEDLDESAHARRVAGILGSRHEEILLREIDPATVLGAIAHLDEPMADAAALPTWVLAEAASRSATVVMTGDGADALLAGDHWYRRLRRLDRLERLPVAGRRAVAALSSLAGARSGERMRHLAGLAGMGRCARYLRIREKWSAPERARIYADGFRELVDQRLAEATYLEAPVRWERGGSVDAAMRLDAIHGLPEDLLMKVDKMGMAHGVECRSPFLDREWVEWVSRLRVDLLLKGDRSKYLLKRAAEDLLPRDLIYRRKQGFRVPIGRWLKGPLRELTAEAFSSALVKRQGIFDPKALAELEATFMRATPSAALEGKTWQIVAFQTWWRQCFQ